MTTRSTYSIGQLGDRFGLAPHVLRYWEEMGLLEAERGPDGRRRYRNEDLCRVAMIRLGKAAGMTLPQLREVLDARGDRQARMALFRSHRDALESRIAEAQASLELIDHALHCEADDFTECPEFRTKVAAQFDC